MTLGLRPGTELPGHEPAVGVVLQFGVLAVVAADAGLGLAGWLSGTAYALVTCAVLTLGLRRPGTRTLGPADRVTLARATLVGGVTALVADSVDRRVPVAPLVALAAVALALDALDGQVARRTGTVTDFGARFDMEVDAFLILVLSVFVARSLGGWVLAIGAMRYAFVAAAGLLPWLRAPLPPRFSRKTVAAVQGIVLAAASAGVAPKPLALAGVALSLALLVWSFARDIGWLWRTRRGRVPGGSGVAGSGGVGSRGGGPCAVGPCAVGPRGGGSGDGGLRDGGSGDGGLRDGGSGDGGLRDGGSGDGGPRGGGSGDDGVRVAAGADPGGAPHGALRED